MDAELSSPRPCPPPMVRAALFQMNLLLNDVPRYLGRCVQNSWNPPYTYPSGLPVTTSYAELPALLNLNDA